MAKTGHEMMKSTKSKLVYIFANGARVYSHTIPNVMGTHFVVYPSPDAPGSFDWEAKATLEECYDRVHNLYHDLSHAPVYTGTDGIPDNCDLCGCAIHTDAATGRLVHGFDPAL